jgi:hypothetical protein
VCLDDSQWAPIAQFGGLPKKARPKVERVVKLYLRLKKSDDLRFTAAKIRRGIAELERDARKLSTRLNRVTDDEVFAFASANYPRNMMAALLTTNIANARKGLEGAARTLEALAEWSSQAQIQIRASDKGPKTSRIYDVVAAADRILEEFTARQIHRSSKKTDTTREYVAAIVQTIFPEARKGTIEEAMKDRISRRGKEGV